MTDKGKDVSSRRGLPQGRPRRGAALAAGAAGRARRADDPLITEMQDWNQYLGDGVDARPTVCRRNTRRMWCGATCPG
jgi:sulfane dehydrogenase subunit SoxC